MDNIYGNKHKIIYIFLDKIIKFLLVDNINKIIEIFVVKDEPIRATIKEKNYKFENDK